MQEGDVKVISEGTGRASAIICRHCICQRDSGSKALSHGKRSLHLDHLVLTNIVCYSLIPWESTSNACLIKICC